jgi:hypothetical protein
MEHESLVWTQVGYDLAQASDVVSCEYLAFHRRRAVL